MTVNLAWNVLNFRMPVARALRSRGDEVAVLSPPDATVPQLEAQGLRHIPLAMDTKGLNPVRDAWLARRMWRHFRRERPDVVLSYTIKNNIFGAFAARFAGVPFIPNVSGLGTAFLSGGVLMAVAQTLYRLAFRGLDTVFFQNADDLELFVSRRMVQASQAHLLPGSGINLTHFAPSPLPDGPVTFLMIGRLLRDKGVLEYVEAARLMRSSHPDVRFQLLGASGFDNRTAIDAATVQRWQDEGVIDYLGTTDDVRPLIAAATCVVLPSYREGAPRTLIEAASMARPLIATDVPGCRAVVADGETGYLCTVKSGASLAEACARFAALAPEQAAAMGAAGRTKMVAEYDEALVVAAYLEAIDRAVGRAGKA